MTAMNVLSAGLSTLGPLSNFIEGMVGKSCECNGKTTPRPSSPTAKPIDAPRIDPSSDQSFNTSVMEKVFDLIDTLIATFAKMLGEKFSAALNETEDSSPSAANQTSSNPAPSTTTALPSSTPSTTPATSTDKTTSAKQTKAMPKTGEFLWKPTSEKDKKLAILLPKRFTGKEIKGVHILGPDKKTPLAHGKYSGIGNGDRMHYRFSTAGSHFPDGSWVELVLKNGTRYQVQIPDTAKRFIR